MIDGTTPRAFNIDRPHNDLKSRVHFSEDASSGPDFVSGSKYTWSIRLDRAIEENAGSFRFREETKIEEDFDLAGKELGTGLNGSVFLATHRSTGVRHAVKSLSKVGLTRAAAEELREEVQIHLEMDHPNVVRLDYVYADKGFIHLVMELMEGGELQDRLSLRSYYGEQNAADSMRQMLQAVAYMHAHDLVHRDLKLTNFLCESEASDSHIKLIDFGFAKHYKDLATQTPCGSLHYVAPETLESASTEKSDIWAMGVIAHLLLTGSPLFFGTESHILGKISKGEPCFSPRLDKLSTDSQSFVKALLSFDPSARPSAADALELPWLKTRNPSPRYPIDGATLRSLQEYTKASKFQRACFSMIAWSVSAEDIAELRHQFEAIDTDHSGTISLPKLRGVLEQHLEFEGVEAEALFDQLDPDCSGEIAYTAFIAACLSTRIGLSEHALRAAFERFDADRKGAITADELRQVLGLSCSEDAEELLREADTDGDGRICYEEFCAFLGHADASSPQSPSNMQALHSGRRSSGEESEGVVSQQFSGRRSTVALRRRMTTKSSDFSPSRTAGPERN